jgi:cytochrome c oxidase subunit III
MSLEQTRRTELIPFYIFTPEEHEELQATAFVRHRLEEQFRDLDQQHEVASLGMWVFLATEVLFFGTLFLSLGVYRYLYPVEFEKASEKMNVLIGGLNTIVLLVSSVTMVLAVHNAKHGRMGQVTRFLTVTALLGCVFLCLKGLEYYTDYRDNLIPNVAFDEAEWLNAGLPPDKVPHVKLFLLFYWVMTGLHALHVTIGIIAVAVIAVLTRRGHFSRVYYSPIDVTGLYWHFVDLVWIFLLPMLYLQGTHRLTDFHF